MTVVLIDRSCPIPDMVWLVMAYRTPWCTANASVFLIKMAKETSKIPKRNAIRGSVASVASTSALPRRLRFSGDGCIFFSPVSSFGSCGGKDERFETWGRLKNA